MTCPIRRAGLPQSDGSILDVMEISDGQFLVRVGTEVVGVTHGATGDPHPQYQLRSEKGAANGYGGLDAASVLSQPWKYARFGLLADRPVLGTQYGEGYFATDSGVRGRLSLWRP